MPTSRPSVEYALNELGQRLVPAIEAIAEVGEEFKRRSPEGSPTVPANPRLKHFRATLDPPAGAAE